MGLYGKVWDIKNPAKPLILRGFGTMRDYMEW